MNNTTETTWEDIKYLINKRDEALNWFNEGIKSDEMDEIIHTRFENLMKVHKQLKLAEDALLTHRIIKK